MAPVSDVELLYRSNLPLVKREVSQLMRRLPPHVDGDDLTSTGLMALFVCARGYSAERDVPFAHLARLRIRWALLDHLRSLDWASRSVRSRARRVNSVQEECTARLGRTPTWAELADNLGISVREVAAAVGDVRRASVLSLQDLPGETMDFLVAGRAPDPEEQALLREQVRYLHDAVDALPKRLRTIVVQCFFEDRPMVETADELGVSENRAGRLRHQALGLLRDGINSQLNPEMLPEQGPATGGSAARRRAAYYAEIASKNATRNRGGGADPEASHLRNPR